MRPPKRPMKDPDQLYNDNLALLKRLEEKERRIEVAEIEIASRVEWIRKLQTAIGYDNSDGKHSQPDPIEMAETMKQRISTLEAQLKEALKCQPHATK